MRAANSGLTRYLMSADEILDCARQAAEFGYGTVVLQSGETQAFPPDWLAAVVRDVKSRFGLAVTLSVGERRREDLAAWREAGADRYLLRFETADPRLYAALHPARDGGLAGRIDTLRTLRTLGYEVGSGMPIGIPGQTYAHLARDLELCRELDLDMIGVGPFIAHPHTPLAHARTTAAAAAEQVPASEPMTYKVLALARLTCPAANIPSTTALATLNKRNGRELGLRRGANVVMPNLTPPAYRGLYEIYPAKACITETAADCNGCMKQRIRSLGRTIGEGPGNSPRHMLRESGESPNPAAPRHIIERAPVPKGSNEPRTITEQ